MGFELKIALKMWLQPTYNQNIALLPGTPSPSGGWGDFD